MFKTFDDIGALEIIAPMSGGNYFSRLEDVSGVQPQAFYNLYKNPSATECLKIPYSASP